VFEGEVKQALGFHRKDGFHFGVITVIQKYQSKKQLPQTLPSALPINVHLLKVFLVLILKKSSE